MTSSTIPSNSSNDSKAKQMVIHSSIHKPNAEKTNLTGYMILQTIVGSIIGLGVASALDRSKAVTCVFVITGSLLAPIVQKIHGYMHGENNNTSTAISPSISISKKEPMTKERALELLGVPAERAHDQKFIDSRYVELMQKVTPKYNLGTSPLAMEVNDLLADIQEADKVLNNLF